LCGLFSVTSASRMLYGAARDGSVAFLAPFARVSSLTGAPITSVLFVCILTLLPALTITVNPFIFLAISSLSTIGLAFSYAAPIFCRVFLAHSTFQPGHFRLGRWSYLCGGIAVGWSIFICIVFSLPAIYPLTPETSNYSSVGLILVLLWVTVTWIWARHWYKGPSPEICNSDIVKVKPHAWG
ncbi:hypothetical protein WJX84_009819, partial [Apatococcus fuscideae]